MVWRLQRCCCVDLRTAGMAQAWFEISLMVFVIIETAKRLMYTEPVVIRDHFDIKSHFKAEHIRQKQYIALVFFVIDIIVCALLIFGIKKKNQYYLYPFLVVKFLNLLIVVPVAIYGFFRSFSSHAREIFEAVLFTILVCLLILSWIVIYSLYHELSELAANSQRHLPVPVYMQTMPMTMPVAEPYYDQQQQKPISEAPPPSYSVYQKT